MAKKKRKHFIKLNNKIKALFNNLPFEDGISKIDDDILMALAMHLKIKLDSLEKEDIIRALRRLWSEGDYKIRKEIVEFLENSFESVITLPQKIETITSFIKDLAPTSEEIKEVIDSFKEIKLSKITKEKAINKLKYIRQKRKIKEIEERFSIKILDEVTIESVKELSFKIANVELNKKFLLRYKLPITIDQLVQIEQDKIENIIVQNEQEAIKIKLEEILLLDSLIKNNCYLSQEEGLEIIQKIDTPLDDLFHLPIPIYIIEEILKEIEPTIQVKEDHKNFLISAIRSTFIFENELLYHINLSYDKEFLYKVIWESKPIPIIEDIETLNQLAKDRFNVALEEILHLLREEAKDLDITDSQIQEFILEYLKEYIENSKKLKIKEKLKRKILYHFNEYLKPIREQKSKEELLAKSIRDFKMLYPLARSLKRKIIFHVGPTNSGKTYQALERLKRATTGVYLAPLRLLALEGYEELKKSNIAVSLITGEEEIIDENATHVSSTIEMMSPDIEVDCCVIDEIQMISDRDRGWAWANALIGAPAKEVILTGSKEALEVVKELAKYLDEELEIIEFNRKNELEVLNKPISLNKIEKESAIVTFSRKEVLALKQKLQNRYKISVIYGNLSPEVRRNEARKFREKESDILIATDAISMGLNLPIKTLVFAKDNKFDGVERRELTTSEVVQIAGRAGRYGIHEKGYISALNQETLLFIKEKLNEPLQQIKLPISVMATLEHILLIKDILKTESLQTILEFFAQNMEFEGPFKAAKIDSMLEIASIVDEYNLDIESKYHLSCAPLTLSSPYIEQTFHRYLKYLEEGKSVPFIEPKNLPDVAPNYEALLHAEDRVREVSLYLWLSFKFEDKFLDVQKAKETREILNKFIENSLAKGAFVKRCRICNRELDIDFNFTICDRCFNRIKLKRGKK